MKFNRMRGLACKIAGHRPKREVTDHGDGAVEIEEICRRCGERTEHFVGVRPNPDE